MPHLSKIKPAISLLTLFLLATVNFAFAKTITYENVQIQRAQVELTEEQLLDIGILIFDPNIPEEERELIFPEIRKAEARYQYPLIALQSIQLELSEFVHFHT
jgi:hypothetical protein